jgi:hypothetical protein
MAIATLACGNKDLDQAFSAFVVLPNLVCRVVRGFRLGCMSLFQAWETVSRKGDIIVQKDSYLNQGLRGHHFKSSWALCNLLVFLRFHQGLF